MVYQSGRRDEMLGLSISRTANASAELHLQRERERWNIWSWVHTPVSSFSGSYSKFVPRLLGGCGAVLLRLLFINSNCLSCPSTRTLATVLRTFPPQLSWTQARNRKKLTLSSGHLNLNKRRVSHSRRFSTHAHTKCFARLLSVTLTFSGSAFVW